MTTAVDNWPAYARLLAVATAGQLSTAPTPRPGTQLFPIAIDWFFDNPHFWREKLRSLITDRFHFVRKPDPGIP
jgi:hypothetical protein